MITRRRARTATVLIICLWLAAPMGVQAAEAGFISATVVKVYDGDTILARKDGREEKVRLIGIDCPEVWENEKFVRDMKREKRLEPEEVLALGRAAKEFTENACPPGTEVALELDEEGRDKYGRLLAYVWLDGRMLNAELVRAGMAKLMTIPPDMKYAGRFRKLRDDARASGRGIWKD
ncbi:MAG TPA: thermonuclease family protein [Nitrospirota bacterium]